MESQDQWGQLDHQVGLRDQPELQEQPDPLVVHQARWETQERPVGMVTLGPLELQG